jgi:hypothetical protein
MKRRVEFLVEKRDGRLEWLRASKLARSIHLAFLGSGVNEDWRALDVATAVLAGLRERRAGEERQGRQPATLKTAELADAVQHVLVATGAPTAAAAYGAVSAQRSRQRRSLEASSGRVLLPAVEVLPQAPVHVTPGRFGEG